MTITPGWMPLENLRGPVGPEGPKGEPGGVTPESVAAALPERLSEAGLAATLGTRRRVAGGTVTTGDVMLFGEHAYAANGIATAAVFGGAPLYENVIGGNLDNVGTATSNLIGAPTLTGQNGNWNFLLGGYDNVVNGWACTVGGYHQRVAAGVTNHITIPGGSWITVAEGSEYSSVLGGTRHTITGSNASIGGGRDNTAATSGTVAGGSENAAGQNATAGGGYQSKATGPYSAVAGGNMNTSTGNAASIGGGQSNSAAGQAATVPGGRDNVAAGAYSLATGRGGKTERQGEWAHGNQFAVAGDAQASTLVLKRETTNATLTALSDSGTQTPLMTPLSTCAFSGLIVARRTDVEGDHAAFEVKGCIARNAGSNALIGAPVVTSIGATAGAAAWTVVVTQSSGRLVFNVTGETGKTIRWVATLNMAQVAA